MPVGIIARISVTGTQVAGSIIASSSGLSVAVAVLAADADGVPCRRVGVEDVVAPLAEEVETYVAREVLPHAPDAWIDHEKTKVGYEIPFNRHFYQYQPPRDLAEIDADLDAVSAEIMKLLQEVHS